MCNSWLLGHSILFEIHHDSPISDIKKQGEKKGNILLFRSHLPAFVVSSF